MADDIAFLTAHQLLERYRAKSLSPVEVLDAVLARLDRLEPVLNAFQHVDPESARAAATESESRWAKGEPVGRLDGLPVSIKDLVAVAGWPMRSGSLTTDAEHRDTEDAPSAARLREAGAVLFAKTTTPEFGWKGMTDSPLAGITRNPWNPSHTAGGSSGGAGASVAAGISPVAHGNDGGGSIRIPSSYNGLYGIKPSFGRVPHSPTESPFATTAANGPLARSVADLALLLNEMARPDPRDWHALPYDGRDYLLGLDDGIAGMRLAYAPGLGGAEADPEVLEIVTGAVGRFAELGSAVEQVGPVIEPLKPLFEDYWHAGFGYIVAQIPEAKRDLMEPRFRELAETGMALPKEAVYAGMVERARLGQRMNAFHQDFDLLLTPTTPTAAPPAETPYHSQAFDRWRHAVPYTLPFNLTGQPAASVPCGLTAGGLPVGLQIVGPAYGEAQVLRAARAFEQAVPFAYPEPKLG